MAGIMKVICSALLFLCLVWPAVTLDRPGIHPFPGNLTHRRTRLNFFMWEKMRRRFVVVVGRDFAQGFVGHLNYSARV